MAMDWLGLAWIIDYKFIFAIKKIIFHYNIIFAIALICVWL